jgi:nitric oxide reductase NorD protein
VNRLRGLWFESRHLESGTPALAAELATLPEGDRAALLAIGDRLAGVSLTLAQQYCRRAPAAWRLGPEAFARWVTRGERLATERPGSREAALSYFALAPAALAAIPAAEVDAWLELARRVLGVSRRLGEIFVAATGPALPELDPRTERLARWVDEGLDLLAAGTWEAELLALHFFEASALVLPLLAPGDVHSFAELGRAAERLGGRPELFASVPPALHRLPEADRGGVVRLAWVAAERAPAIGLELYFSLPAALAALAAADRASLLASLAPVAARLPEDLADLLPVLRAVLEAVPPGGRGGLVTLAAAVAAAFPAGVAPLYRVLPRVLERAGPAGVERWVRAGLAIAAENAEAGRAYFGLASRTGRAVLAAESTAVEIAEVEGLLKRYLRMLTGGSWRPAGDPAVGYRPPLAHPFAAGAGEADAEREALFPLRVDAFPTTEANLRLYRLIAAQHAGRAAFGSDALDPPLPVFLAGFDFPELAAEILAVLESARVDAALARAYRGLASDLRALAGDAAHAGTPLPGTLDHLAATLRRAGRASFAPRLAAIGERLAAAGATVRDSAEATRLVYAELMRGDRVAVATADPEGFADYLAESEVLDARLELDAGVDGLGDGERPPGAGGAEPAPAGEPAPLELAPERDQGAPGVPIDPGALLRMLKEGARFTVRQGSDDDVEALGLYISDLAGKLPRERLRELEGILRLARAERAPPGGRAAGDGAFVYDEWDHRIGDYRPGWCRLAEIPLADDAGDFFERTLAAHADLLPEVRRQFQRIRPERYRVVHGLEDGEDFDLNAVIDARADRRAGRPPSPKIYQARQREERDVATLFLIDMSASTDEAVPDAPGRRVIDIIKEALVVMTEALDEIGDTYGICGFSGHGREQVELYLVKHFHEALTPAVKGRIGAIAPKRSTRMGAALRHAVAKLRSVPARSRHVILLSDGFPQDLDYGDDRRSNTYAIQDTMMAFQEATRAEVMPFCITVDKAGHDYLRRMCEPSRYLVIEDITALPRELPKIYQRFVRP